MHTARHWLALALLAAACDRSAASDPQPPLASPTSTTSGAAEDPESASAAPSYFAGALILTPDGSRMIEWFMRVDPQARRNQRGAGAVSLWIPEQHLADLPSTTFARDDEGAYEITWEHLGVEMTIDPRAETCRFQQHGGRPECEVERIDADEFADYAAPERPQHPRPPFEYEIREVAFEHPEANGVSISGTLTVPRGEGPFPAAVLISGSGPQDRDETLVGHKPFLVIADHLTRHGIAVYRYDDRGVGGSTGKTGGTLRDNASDAMAALRTIAEQPEVDRQRVGFVGHSEGGLIAPLLAAEHPAEIAYVVMLAGPGVPGREVLAHQLALIEAAEDPSENPEDNEPVYRAVLDATLDLPRDRAVAEATAAFEAAGKSEALLDQLLTAIGQPWMQSFLNYDPQLKLAEVRCPVLALNGTTDLQVDDKQNLPPIEAALKSAPTKDFRVEARPGLNHLFQSSESGAISEYAEITETFDPETLVLIGTWIADRTKADAPTRRERK